MADKYESETLVNYYKICPMTGDRAYYNCECYDCSNVKEDDWHQLSDGAFSVSYRCGHEHEEALRLINAHVKKIESKNNAYIRLKKSLAESKNMNPDKFFAYCKEVDDYLLKNAQSYGDDMVIYPYVESGYSFLMYCLKDGVPVEIHVAERLLNVLSKYFTQMMENPKCQFSYAIIPSELKELVVVNLYLKYNFEIRTQLTYENPIYLKSGHVKSYMEVNYGMTTRDFKRLLSRHPEITEITNFNNIIYLKHEIDEIIRREGLIG